MKYDHTDTFFDQARREQLTSAEKERMYTFLTSYIAHKPIRTKAIERSPWFIGIAFLRPLPLIAFSLIILLSGGTVFAAEHALPGDALYPIKVSITEEVRAALIVSSEKQALWAVERAERRIAEATLLMAEDRLTPEIRTELDAHITAHAEDAHRAVDNVETTPETSESRMADTGTRELQAHIQSRILAAEKARDRIIRSSVRLAFSATPHAEMAQAKASTEDAAEVRTMALTIEPPTATDTAPNAAELSTLTASEPPREELRGRVAGLIETAHERSKNTDRVVSRLEKRLGSDVAQSARERFNEAERERIVGASAFAEGRLEEAETRFERSLDLMLAVQEDGESEVSEQADDDTLPTATSTATTTATTSVETHLQIEVGIEQPL